MMTINALRLGGRLTLHAPCNGFAVDGPTTPSNKDTNKATLRPEGLSEHIKDVTWVRTANRSPAGLEFSVSRQANKERENRGGVQGE